MASPESILSGVFAGIRTAMSAETQRAQGKQHRPGRVLVRMYEREHRLDLPIDRRLDQENQNHGAPSQQGNNSTFGVIETTPSNTNQRNADRERQGVAAARVR
jgi:hypothetical protein